jgi:ABC-type spermidine/putrescine transport system permease subunit I
VTAALHRGAPSATRAARFAARHGWLLVLVPGGLFLLIFFGYPLLTMAVRSLTDPGPENYTAVATSPVYRQVLLTTLRTAGVTTLVCLALAYPYAYRMSRASARTTALMMALVLLPFWSSLLVRTFSWTVLLQDTGLINGALLALGVVEQPLELIRTSLGVQIGMVHILLPYMVLPLFTAMRRIDPMLVPAAQSLGASPSRAFARVTVPLSMPGVYAGAVLVFVLSLGFYVTPALLGGPQNTMLGEVIATQVTRFGFGIGSALGMVLLVVTLITLAGLTLLGRAGALTREQAP